MRNLFIAKGIPKPNTLAITMIRAQEIQMVTKETKETRSMRRRKKITGKRKQTMPAVTQDWKHTWVFLPVAKLRTESTTLCPPTLPPRPTIIVKNAMIAVCSTNRLLDQSRIMEETLWHSMSTTRQETRGQKRCIDSTSCVQLMLASGMFEAGTSTCEESDVACGCSLSEAVPLAVASSCIHPRATNNTNNTMLMTMLVITPKQNATAREDRSSFPRARANDAEEASCFMPCIFKYASLTSGINSELACSSLLISVAWCCREAVKHKTLKRQ
mmetsp:Transcript_29629/g.78499  ORF Transcript_29629/g.78499 Transcript_29629/m.78499 type:complete len:272 (+) Transcript_29629:327-1142(+)